MGKERLYDRFLEYRLMRKFSNRETAGKNISCLLNCHNCDKALPQDRGRMLL